MTTMPSRDFKTMFPQIPADAPIVSQSTINSLEISPCRWLYRAEKHEPSEAMFFGTVVHGMIEGFLEGEFTTWEVINPEAALVVAIHLAEDDGFTLDEKMPAKERRAQFALDVTDATQAWLRDWWQADDNQDLTIRSIEEPFAMQLARDYDEPEDQPEAWFVTGGIDLLLEDWTMRDWKTSAVMWSKGKGTALSQKEAYAMLVNDKYGIMPTKMEYVVYDRARKYWDIRPGDITPQSVQAYRARVDGWVRYMRDPFHLCTPSDGKTRGWWSKPTYNDVWDRCPSCRHLGDSWDKKERKVDQW